MNITWFGHSCFRIQGEDATLLFNPFKSDEVGLKLPKIEANAVLLTHKHFDHDDASAVEGESFVIDGPGEYEIGGAMIYGIPAFHGTSEGAERGTVTIYIVKLDGITFCHLGDFGQKELSEDQMEKIGDIDVLFIPVGGIYTIGAKEARTVVNQIEPRIVIPMHYALPGLKFKLDKVDGFLKEVGGATRTVEGKLTIKKKDLPQEGMEVVLINI